MVAVVVVGCWADLLIDIARAPMLTVAGAVGGAGAGVSTSIGAVAESSGWVDSAGVSNKAPIEAGGLELLSADEDEGAGAATGAIDGGGTIFCCALIALAMAICLSFRARWYSATAV